MEIQTFYCNPYRECTYIVTCSKDCLIVDPGMYGDKEEKRVLDYLHEHALTPTAILITHYHPDHTCGLECIQNHYPNLPVIDFHTPSSISAAVHTPYSVLPTPGHTADAVCFYFENEKVLFSGDTLFQECIGRTDLPGGDMKQLIQSLETLKKLPDDTQVYPGHGHPTSIGHEKAFNPYL